MTWNISVPADTDPIRQGASAIRSIEADLTTALSTEGVFPGAAPSSPVFRWKPRQGNTASRPAPDPVNPGTVYFNTDTNTIQIDSGTVWNDVAGIIPSGSVQPYMGSSAPAGWLLCNGQAVSRTTYANLFAVLGIACGSGDGSTTFNVPDLRGQFLRGVDGGAGRDPDTGSRTAMNPGGNTGDQLGSVQGDQTAQHGLALTDPGHTHAPLSGTNFWNDNNTATGVGFGAGANNGRDATTKSATTGITLGGGGNETRPTNAYVNFIIKT